MKEETRATSFRITTTGDRLLTMLSQRLGINRKGVLELALRELAIKYGCLKISADKEQGK